MNSANKPEKLTEGSEDESIRGIHSEYHAHGKRDDIGPSQVVGHELHCVWDARAIPEDRARKGAISAATSARGNTLIIAAGFAHRESVVSVVGGDARLLYAVPAKSLLLHRLVNRDNGAGAKFLH